MTLESNVPVVASLGARELGAAPLHRVSVPAGRHVLRLVNPSLGITRRVTIMVRRGAELRERALFRQGMLNIVVDPWADVWLNGAHLGQTPLAGRAVWEGTHDLRLVGPGGEKSLKVVVRPDATTVVRETLR